MMDHPMHEHELDLIMALAEGSLSGAELEAAEATIAACDGCGAELSAQRLALAALHDAPVPALTELEGARMRRALRDELGLVTPEPVAAAPSRRTIPWQRLSVALSAAAVVLLFVAVVPALDLFRGGADDSADVALAPTTEVAAESAPDDGSGRMESGVEEAPTFTATGDASTTTLLSPAEEGLAVDFGADPDLVRIQSASQRGLTETGDAANLLGLGLDLDSLFVDPAVDACVAEALASFADGRDAVVLGTGSLLDDDVFLVAYVNDAASTVELVAHEAATCQVLRSEG